MFDNLFKVSVQKHKENSFISYVFNLISFNNSMKQVLKTRTPLKNPINLDSREEIENFLSSFDTILCDCDGVLWINNSPVEGAPEALNKLRAIGKKIIFATNNSTKSREQFVEKLTKMGYIVNNNELFPTSFSAASYLKSNGFKKKVYIIGSKGIQDELEKVGIESIGIGPDITPEDWSPGMAPVRLDPDVGAVIVGFDNQISFPKLVKVCSYVSQKDCIFIAANEDESYPTVDPSIKVPGPGGMQTLFTLANKS
jgi:phosphoglycolate phosphatase